MIRSFFRTAWRNLWKNKVYVALNVAGLAIGMAACILILIFVFYEKSFDSFHTKNLYRLNEVQKFEGMAASQKVALSMYPMGPALRNDFPEIKNFTRVSWMMKQPVVYKEKTVYLSQALLVDSTFLDMFNFPLVEGDRATALMKPNSAVLTKETARKIFGDDNPIGKTILGIGGDTITFMVTGIMRNVPQNSQMKFDALFSFNSLPVRDWMNSWDNNWLNTYLELQTDANVAALQKKFPTFLKEHMAQNEGWKNYELFLLPLRSVHAGASDIGLDYLNYQKFDKRYTRIFFIIALIVLIIACINFMNLSTARSAERAREVGVRKTIGALRWQLSAQFISESVILALLALVLAVVFVELTLPYVNTLSGRTLLFPLFSSLWLAPLLLVCTITLGILSGLYPAAFLSSFQPIKVLKGALQGGGKGRLRNALVVIQFSSAIFLMIATFFAVRQLRYMQQRDPGFDREQVITVPLDRASEAKYQTIKQELLLSNVVTGVTAAQDQLGSHLDQSGVEFRDDGPLRQLTGTRLIVDPDYLTLYKIPLVAGKNFSGDKSANGREYILNEAMAKELLKDKRGASMASLIGKHFGFDSAGVIVGIARDFNFNSLHYKIETLFLFSQTDWGWSTLSMRVNGNKAQEAIALLQSVWQRNFPGHPFEYQFLDDHFSEVYGADAQVSKVVGVLAALAIFISCLGLFGLASYSAERRIKEVGIRKVLGASVRQIVAMLSSDFLKYVLIAALIALPLAWYSVHRWLDDYAYRIDISWWVFVMAVMAALLIAFITVSFQAIRAAIANPVKSLRTE